MKKVQKLIRKTLKAILWVAVIFVLLFLIVAGFIQIPAVQNKIVRYATSFVSDKTHTRVTIDQISISFPKSVVIEGLFLEDKQKDTLLFVGKIKANIALTDLIINKINVGFIAVEDLKMNVHRHLTDSLFNYNFLIEAFSSDTTKQSKAKSAWSINVNNVNLKNIRLHYDDEPEGMNANVGLSQLQLSIDKLDVENMIFNINDLSIEGLIANILITEHSQPNSKSASGILPSFTAKNIHLERSAFDFKDVIANQAIKANINKLEIKDGTLNLQKQLVTLKSIGLQKSEVYCMIGVKKSISDTTLMQQPTTSDWKVDVQNINLRGNKFIYKTSENGSVKNSFDPTNILLKHVSLKAKDLMYSSAKSKITVLKFNAIDQNNFTINNLETNFSMDYYSISAQSLKIKTPHSAINADLSIRYASLQSLKESPEAVILNLNMKEISLNNSDLLYFAPQLSKLTFFKHKTNKSTLSGKINGQVGKLTGKNIILKTGANTVLKTNFTLVGLPNFKTANFQIPSLKIASSRRDIEMMVGASAFKQVKLPERIDLSSSFKGQLKAFASIINLNSSYGSAHLDVSVDKQENFKSKINIVDFDLGSLLHNKAMYGAASLNADIAGHGFDKKTVTAQINAQIPAISLNRYTYRNLSLQGQLSGQQFEGKVKLDDKNATCNFDGLVNLKPREESYKFSLNVKGINLQKLNLSEKDLRIGLKAEVDLTGGSVHTLNGKANITNLILLQDGKNYVLDSVLIASINTPNKSEINIKSSLLNLHYTGAESPTTLPAAISRFIDRYFPISKNKAPLKKNAMSNFNFDIQLFNHPILSEVIFPNLKEFEPGIIQGKYDSVKNSLTLNAGIKKIVYGKTQLNDFKLDINSDSTAINYKMTGKNVSNSQLSLDNFLFDGKLAHKTLTANISIVDSKNNKKLQLQSKITKVDDNYKLIFDPAHFYLMNNRWDIAADHFIEFGKSGLWIHHSFLNNADGQINIASANDRHNDDLSISIRNFKIEDISRIIEKDSSLLRGNVNGKILLKNVNNSYGLIADAAISGLFVRNIPIGNLSLKAENTTNQRFDLDLKLSGTENKLSANGYFITNTGNNSFNIKTDIQSLSMKTVEAFSMGQVTEASGSIAGNILLAGKTNAPEITGAITFNNVFLNPTYLNSRIELKHENIQLKTDGVYFNSFTLLDHNQQKAVVDGSIKMKQFTDYTFDLQANTKNFQLFNTSASDNKEFYGRMIIDSKIAIKGPLALPVVNAKLKMKKGSNFTFAVPEDKLTTDKGENVVDFEDTLNINSILYRTDRKIKKKSAFTGFDLSSVIEIDKEATLRLLMDPTSSDSLVVRGDAALSFTMDRSGKMSLTGAYNLNDGNYLMSIESVIKRKFVIIPGSTIVWNGDPLDANVSINASYLVRAAPYDLVADQMIGLSDIEKGGYKQMYPFKVLLKLRGAILQPEISFEIQLAPEDKGIMGGAVNQKLIMLNDDPSSLNKQVFALLVMGRFVQQNPLQTEVDPTSTLLRSTISNFLSAQLNQFGSKIVPGISLNFDIQSYNDYETGEAKGRTQVEIGLKKELFNERLTVQLGGSVDIEGDKAKQNSTSEITSDVTVEYKLTKDGRYRLLAFRHNLYDGAIEGQLVETGAGVVFVRNFNKWKELFLKPQKKQKMPLAPAKKETKTQK